LAKSPQEFFMSRVALVVGFLAIGVAAAVAQNTSAIEQRQNLMKEMGSNTRAVSGMMRGQPFDLAQVQTALQTFSRDAQKAPSLFPEDSKTGAKTEALPIIWEKKSEFEGIFAKLDQDAKAALAAIKDEATFKSEMPKVLQNCGTCHKTFRQG
jgi:cytochrome c556